MLFLGDNLFWDDFAVKYYKKNELLEYFRDTGSVYNIRGYLFLYLRDLSPSLLRLIIFFLYFFSGIFFYKILKKINILSDYEIFLIVVFFLIFPVNFARVSIMLFAYALFYFFFFLGWYLLFKNKFFSIIFFLASFNLGSLLVFYILPYLHIFFIEIKKNTFNSKKKIELIIFALLPFIFYYIDYFIYPPTNGFEYYNRNFNISDLTIRIIKTFTNFRFYAENFNIFLFFALFFFMFILKEKINYDKINFKFSNRKNFILCIIIIFCSIIPYNLLGYIPSPRDWLSRHQMLMPMGMSLIIVSLLSLIKKNKNFKIFLILFISIFSAININAYSQYLQDSNKQSQFQSFIMNNKTKFESARLVLINDNTKNAQNRNIRFYEYNFLFKKIFGNEIRFVIPISHHLLYFDGFFNKHFSSRFFANQHKLTYDKNFIKTININQIDKNKFYRQYVFEITN